MPFMDRRIELHPGIAADVGALSNLAKKCLGVLALAWFSVADTACPPFTTFCRCFHEGITDPDTQIFVLIHDRAVGVSVITPIVPLLDEGPRFPLLVWLGINEFLDVRMPIDRKSVV